MRQGLDSDFHAHLNDVLTLRKRDGRVLEGIKAHVSFSPQSILIMDINLPMAIGDWLVRQLPNGGKDEFVVDNPRYVAALQGLPAHFQVRYHRAMSVDCVPQSGTGTGITGLSSESPDTDAEEDPPISITVQQAMIFLEFPGGRQLSVAKGGPHLVPAWVMFTDTFRHGSIGRQITVLPNPANTSQQHNASGGIVEHLFRNLQTANFWRERRQEFDRLATRQKEILGTPTHPSWLKASIFYPSGTDDLSHCRVRTGLDGLLISDFEDTATRAAAGLQCPEQLNPERFWLYCLARNLLASDRREIQNEILGDRTCGGIVRDLLASSAAFSSRLAAEAERQTRGSVGADEAKERVAPAIDSEQTIAETAAGRGAIVTPILKDKGWSRSKWAARSGVGKNSVYEYLDGKRSLSAENRKAMAEALDLKPDQLPD